MKIFILAALVLSSNAFIHTIMDNECATDIIKVQNELIAFAQSIQKDIAHPDLAIVKDILATLDTTLLDCKGIKIDLTVFDVCVDKVQPVFDYIVKIVADIQSSDFGSLELHSLELATYIASTVVPCFQNPVQLA